MDKKKIIYWLLLPGILVSLIGCAVMTVDVDVYKGPLANHEDIQIEQMAVMAIGAKPLLIQLRDHLEWQDKEVRLSRQGEAWYVENYNYILPKVKRLEKENARRVNSILSLYLDKFPSELAPLYKEGNKAYDNLVKALYILRPNPEKVQGVISKLKSEQIWKEIEGGLRAFSDKPRNKKKFAKEVGIADEKIVNKLYKPEPREKRMPASSLENLRVAYESFLIGGKNGWRSSDKIFRAHSELWEDLKDTDLLEGLYPGPPLLDLEYDVEKGKGSYTSANSEFDALRKGKLVKAHAELLFKSEAKDEKEKFVSRVSEIADSFHTVRANMNTLLRLTLQGKGLIHDKGPSLDDYKMRLLNSALDKFAVSLIRPKYLWFALENENSGKVAKSFRKSFAKIVGEENLINLVTVQQKDTRYKEKLEKVLDDKDGSNAYALLSLHKEFINKPFKLIDDNKTNYIDHMKKKANKEIDVGYFEKYELEEQNKQRNYGITSVPDDDVDIDISGIEDFFDSFTSLMAGGLEGGRLNYGLESLIEQYINAKAKPLSDKNDIISKRDFLLDAMVRFAEKVLFIANNNSLFRGNHDVKELNQYVLVLQSVGNSILIQVDELRHRKTYKQNLKKMGKSELLAMNQSLRLSPKEVIDNVIAGLGADLREKEKQLRAKETEKQDAEKRVTEAESELAKAQASHDKANTDKVSAKTKHDNIVSSNQKYLDAYATMTGEYADSIKEAVVKEEDISGDKLVDKITKWLKEKQGVVHPESEEIKRLVNTIKYFDALKGKVTHLSDKGGKVFSDISNIVKNNKVDAEKQIKVAKDDLDKKEKVFNDAKSQLAISEEKKAQAIANKTSTIAKHDTTSKDKTKLENSIAMINGIRTKLMNQLNESGIEAPSAVFLLLISLVKEDIGVTAKELETVKKKPVSDENKTEIANLKEKKKKLEDTKNVLSDLNLPKDPSRMKELLSGNNEENKKEVMDNLIATLRHEHVQRVREGGKKHAKHIEEAIKLAYKYREGMVYIRPSGAYLRSSYPSTSLQGDPGLGWKNMLGQHGVRNIPFFGGMHKKDTKRKAEITAEIDKQYWQNINRVRVAGAGRTNYVIAKDDIGNWYVKQYSADTEDIIKTAKNLAMFNMSAQMGTNLISRLPKEGKMKEGEQVTGKKADANRSSLEKLFSKYQLKYEGDTNSGFEGVIKILSEDEEDATAKKSRIVNRIYQSWAGNEDTKKKLTELDGRLDSAAKGTLAPALKSLKDNSKKSVQVKAGEIINVLHSTRRFHNVLTLGIRDLKLTVIPTKGMASANEAKKTADKELEGAGNALSDVEKRRGLVKEELDEKSKYVLEKRAEKKKARELAQENIDDSVKYKTLSDKADIVTEELKDAEGEEAGAKAAFGEAEKAVTKANNVVTEKQNNVQAADKEVKTMQEEINSAKRAEKFAMNEVTRIVREELMKFVNVRKDVVGDYETGIMFIGEAIKE